MDKGYHGLETRAAGRSLTIVPWLSRLSFMLANLQPAARRRYARLNPALALLLLAQVALGMLRIQIVPLGFNVDEIIHFAHAKLVAAACLRDSVGLSWSLHRNDSEPRNNSPLGEDVTAWIAFSDQELQKIDPDGLDSAPCDLLYDNRRLTNSAYYLWAGLPMALLNNLSDHATINLGRMATLILGLASTVFAYGTARRLFPRTAALPIGVATLMALNQHLGDITTGVNTDAGAVFAITLLLTLLAATRLRKITTGTWAVIFAALLLCLFVKSTAWIGLPIAALWLAIRIPVMFRRWSLICTFIASIALAGVLLPVRWDVPAHWFVQEAGKKVRFVPATARQEYARIGTNALHVDSRHAASGLVQYLPETTVAKLRGKTITIGAWVHLPIGAEIDFPNFSTNSGGTSNTTTGNGSWKFHAMSVEVPSQASYLSVRLPAPKETDKPAIYDGVVLTSAEYAHDVPPSFDAMDARTGVWGTDGAFTNLIRNGSAESMWPRVEVKNIFGLSTNRPLWSLLSWQRTSGAWLRDLPSWLFTMYWSGFGGTQPGLSRWQLWPLFGLTLLAGLGTLRGLHILLPTWQPRVRFSTEELHTAWLLVASTCLIWLMVIMRADIYPHRALMFAFAGTRYGLTAMLPGSILFTFGWMQLLPARFHRTAVAGLVLLLFIISVHILIRVQIPVYECPLTPANLCLNTIR